MFGEDREKTAMKNKISVAMIIISLSLPVILFSAELSREETAELIAEGNRLYEKANSILSVDTASAQELYSKSVLYYERAVSEGGIKNGKLFYNIGNAYYRTGDLGRAVLNYKRAEKFIPGSVELRQNLDFVKQKLVDTIEAKDEKKALELIIFWHYALPFWIRLIIFTAAFALFWGFLLLRLFIRRPVFLWFVILFAVVGGMFFGSLLSESVRSRKFKEGIIIAEEVIARKGNADTYNPSFVEPLHAGTDFVLLEQREDWYFIELVDGRKSWVPADSTELLFPD
jgi:tetratricopeptide (TPR) repeat protein